MEKISFTGDFPKINMKRNLFMKLTASIVIRKRIGTLLFRSCKSVLKLFSPNAKDGCTYLAMLTMCQNLNTAIL